MTSLALTFFGEKGLIMGMFSEGLSVHTTATPKPKSAVKTELEACNNSLAEAEAAGTLNKCGGSTAAFVRALGIPVKEIGESVKGGKA